MLELRCILSARCPFFQALFSDLWTEATTASVDVAIEEVRRLDLLAVMQTLLHVPSRLWPHKLCFRPTFRRLTSQILQQT